MNFSHGLALVDGGSNAVRRTGQSAAAFLAASKRRIRVRFEVKGREYWLALAEANQFYLFAPTTKGIDRIPVYVDAAKYEDNGMLD
jgi:hypothetical protein